MEVKSVNACYFIEGFSRSGNGFLGVIVLIRRYDCIFDFKVLYV